VSERERVLPGTVRPVEREVVSQASIAAALGISLEDMIAQSNVIYPEGTMRRLGTAAGPVSSEPMPGPSGTQQVEEYRGILGDIVIPEGVDPSFLAALPEEMRQEVINEHLR
jgi:hypothetical protein